MSEKSATQLMLEMETELVESLITYLTKGDMERANWQFDVLAKFGVFTRKVDKIGKNNAGKILAAAERQVSEFAEQRARQIDNNMPDGKLADAVPLTASDSVRAAIAQYEASTDKYFTSAVNSMLSSVKKEYRQTVTKVMAERAVKGITGREAIAQIATEWADAGLTAFTDKSLRKWSTEAYSQMIVRTQSTQAAYSAQTARLDDLDQDLVEISSHIGARPRCAPYQGKVYSRSGKTSGYPLLSSTSVGEIDGLFGINCGHNMFPYFPGTKKTYSPYNVNQNEQVYAESQKQRALERNIRKAKKEVQYQKKIGDKEYIKKANKKLKARRATMQSFIKNTGRTRRYGREEIYS